MFKRLLTGLTLIRSKIAIGKCFNALIDVPSLTDKIARYFEVFQGGEKIPEQVLMFISKTDEVFDYQIARLVEIYRYKNHIPSQLENTLFKFACDRNAHWSVRTNCLIALSYMQISTDKIKQLWGLFEDELNFQIKRAMILCFINSSAEKRNEVIRRAMFDTDSRIICFAKFIDDILKDEKTQNYELENLFRIGPEMFIEESYKIILLREASNKKILGKLLGKLSRLELVCFPYHIRHRIESTREYIRNKLQSVKVEQ